MSLPEHFTIIGLGGCGKTLLHRICQHDWFLENYLTDGHDLDLYTIDSATSEVIGKADSEISDYSDIFDAPDRGYKDIGDERKIELLKDHIRELKKNKTGTGRIECYKHVCLSAHASISNIKDLKTPDTIAQIKAIYGSDYVWWLEDKANGIKYENILKQNPKLELATSNGVYRMRGVAKAAFIKAINTPETQFPAFGNGHTIALIVGLGGGTGSGMFIDLARILREKGHTIWLFGVLPSALENPVEKGNAAIALTELEYLNVTSSEKLFHHIILTSLDGTGFPKSITAVCWKD